MSESSLRGLTQARAFPTDANGCFYDPQIRQALDRLHPIQGTGKFEAIAALRLAAKRMHMGMERWAERQGLSEGRLQVLLRLMHQPDHALALGGLADSLEVAPRTVTGLIDHLEQDGLVERVDDPADRRSVQARLTTAGLQRMEAIWRQSLEKRAAIVEGFTDAELAQLRHLCLRLVQNLNRIEGGKS